MTDGQNVGHGHVFSRPDGLRARCGGPALCAVCARDLARSLADKQKDGETAIEDIRKQLHAEYQHDAGDRRVFLLVAADKLKQATEVIAELVRMHTLQQAICNGTDYLENTEKYLSDWTAAWSAAQAFDAAQTKGE